MLCSTKGQQYTSVYYLWATLLHAGDRPVGEENSTVPKDERRDSFIEECETKKF